MCGSFRRPHQGRPGEALVFVAGDRLIVEDRETEWAGWLWCENAAGVAGWAPAAYVQRDGEQGVARRDYDATELTVAAGEKLTVHYEESEWVWCTRANGEKGWAPVANLSAPVR